MFNCKHKCSIYTKGFDKITTEPDVYRFYCCYVNKYIWLCGTHKLLRFMLFPIAAATNFLSTTERNSLHCNIYYTHNYKIIKENELYVFYFYMTLLTRRKNAWWVNCSRKTELQKITAKTITTKQRLAKKKDFCC